MSGWLEMKAMRGKRLLSAVALSALALLLLRPVCDVYAAHALHGHSQDAHSAHHHAAVSGSGEAGGVDGSCCARIADGALVAPFVLAPPVALDADQAAAPGVAEVPPVDSGRAAHTRIAWGAIPPPRSYYARSARILR
jgi:hypothetical protein